MTLLAFLFLLPSAFGATFVVNDLGDASDANPGDGIAATDGGVATLRASIEEANALTGADTITFDEGVFSTLVTIPVSTEITITDTLIIQGPGMDVLTISGQDLTRILGIGSHDVEIYDITFAHGSIPEYTLGGAIDTYANPILFERCAFISNHSVSGGGAMHITGDTTLRDCVFSENTAYSAMGLSQGGAILSQATYLLVENCIFDSNTAKQSGSAINIKEGVSTGFVHCDFVNNQTQSYGTICAVSDAEVNLEGCTLRGNTAINGCAGLVSYNPLFLTNCAFVNNVTAKEGGAIDIRGEAKILNCTITGNEANSNASGDESGGGIYISADGTLQMGNTIVAGNIDHASTGQDVSGTVTSLGGNLIGIGDGSTGFTGTNDQVGTTASPIDAKLGPLQDNGGPTFTCMPQADSPAINAGLNALITNPPFDGPPFYDQRGPDFVRIYEDIVDIGAVERQLPPDTTPPTLTLLGDPLVSHECGTPYTDAGASAEDDIDGDISADIQVTGTVDSATPGEYTLTYNVSDSSGNPATPVSRTVTVQDTTPPQITLIGDPLVSHECHTPYTDAGATASDTCDTALPAVTIDTAAVNTDVPGTYTVSFSVTDAAGNSAPLVSRTVQVTDNLPPTITLVGDNPLTIQCLSTYTDPGATASDTCDAALPAVTIDTSALDPNATGTYTVTYSVTDASSNPAPLVSRTVIVEGSCIPPNHTADQNADYLISLSELLRVIQFFNSGGFHCQTGTEDGYAPGSGGDTSCTPHASDYNPQDWTIGLSELLRLIQFFNSAGYHVCPGSEDGFCPGVGAD